MRIITCAGYYRTGSSAVTDLFSEYEGCGTAGSYEFRFLHDPDGVRDLEYNLIENNNRQNTSHAIKRYLHYARILNGGAIRRGYKRYMGDAFWRCTQEYIQSITELQCEAWWHGDQLARGAVFNFLDNAYGKLAKRWDPAGRASLLKLTHEQAYYSAIDREMFYRCTRDYVRSVIGSLAPEQPDFLMVDQLVPPSNVGDYLNYFDDIRVIVVERDPRDLFILENGYRWGVIPYKRVEDFCQWYEITRRHRSTEVYDAERVLLLQFEDLVYRYEETVRRLERFVGIDESRHTEPRRFFDPAVSIRGTNLEKSRPEYRRQAEYIREHLPQYCYDFEGEADAKVKEMPVSETYE